MLPHIGSIFLFEFLPLIGTYGTFLFIAIVFLFPINRTILTKAYYFWFPFISEVMKGNEVFHVFVSGDDEGKQNFWFYSLMDFEV